MSCSECKANVCGCGSDCGCKGGECTCGSSCACGQEGCNCESKTTMREISVIALKDRLERGDNILVVNVLGEEYYKDCHISNSINVPLSKLKEAAKKWSKDQALVVYCAHNSCDASSKGYNELKALGFTNIMMYEGGMKEWHQKKFPCEGPCEADYLK